MHGNHAQKLAKQEDFPSSDKVSVCELFDLANTMSANLYKPSMQLAICMELLLFSKKNF